MEEMIPLSANIFHAKGDHQSRARAAVDIVLACLPSIIENPDKRNVASELVMELQTMLTPANYDVRGELGAALDGRDTAAPKLPEDGKGPLILVSRDSDELSIYSTREKALESLKTKPGFVVAELALDP